MDVRISVPFCSWESIIAATEFFKVKEAGTGSELLMALVTLSMNKEPQPMIPKNTCWFILSVLFFLCFSINIHLSQGADSVTANQPLSGSQTIVSSGNIFELGFFTPGTSSSYYIGIWYKNVTPMTIVWVANRETPISDMNSAEFKILDGNLMLMDESQVSIWSTNVNLTTSNSLVATLGDNGNLVLRDESEPRTSEGFWQSFDNPTDTLLPGSSLAYDKRTRTKKVLTSWKNSEDPAPGLFSFELDPNGSQVIIRWNRTEWYWTSGAWNGLFFSLIPEMRLNNMYNHSYVDNVNASYYTYSLYNPSIKSRYVMDVSSGIGVPFCSWESIIAATENFSDVNKLGRGGFGPVYKGMFHGGQEIAVKRLSSCSSQGINEFQNEIVLIAKLQHRNLVRLLGYCMKENEKILLYEYMANKSLDAFIFDKKLCMLLDGKKRFDIILGIARGVLYLHQDSRLRIIHRDLKTSNILLDEEMNPKISDFGLARIVEGKRIEASTNKVIGTYGYMSPEYASDGLFSIKSDVFSFGVVVLEIITGKRNTGFYQSTEDLNLLGYVWRLWSENKALDIVDPILLESCKKSEVIKCINVGLLCVEEDPNNRPTMLNVVFMLSGEIAVLPIPNQPAFVMRKRSSSNQPGLFSNNGLTVSIPQGR
ncbi:G-type lectin S-receptor-like serine/threonine-protein kinase At4g03230 [Olea europaea var. sylvestris]|uniref:G-type lectin S-receptor-like serine/threonine-protein kinase At4g03230 n=1 Tax=Olea europaea var. sylvestris TaxID=158386 RepID=UPI000C1D757E|nr:G-type lectin S-receptor-like serine/threonine-protein kinase At4g03230 [Olea europaea var. sylvestris]